MNSNITINNGSINFTNLSGNELIFIKRPLIIKKSTTNNNVNNMSQNNSNLEQNYGHSALILNDITQPLQKSLAKPQTATINMNKTNQPFAKSQRESSLHTHQQQKNSINSVAIISDKNQSTVDNLEPIQQSIKQHYSQVIHISQNQQQQQQKLAQKQALSQRYVPNNLVLNNNLINTSSVTKRPPSASLNSKKITVYQQQQQSFLASVQNQQSALQKKLMSESSNHINRGNILANKTKQKNNDSHDKYFMNENSNGQAARMEKYPKYLVDTSGDNRLVAYGGKEQKSQTQRLFKERNEYPQKSNSKVQKIYSNAIGLSKQMSNSNLRSKEPQSYRDSEEFYRQKQSVKIENSASLERPNQILSKTQLTNSYLIDSSMLLQSPQMMTAQKSLQNFTTNSKVMKHSLLEKQIQSTLQKNQDFYQDSVSPYFKPNSIRQFGNGSKRSSPSTSPQPNAKFQGRVQQQWQIEDSHNEEEHKMSNSYIEIFANDLSKFKTNSYKNNNQDQTKQINEERDNSQNSSSSSPAQSSNSLDSAQRKNMKKDMQTIALSSDTNFIKSQQVIQKYKSIKQHNSNKQAAAVEVLKSARIVQQEPPTKVLNEVDENRILQLKYKLLENNDKTQARRILVKKKSMKQKSANVNNIVSEQSNLKQAGKPEHTLQQQKSIQDTGVNISSQKGKRLTNRGSFKLKKSDSNLGSTSQTDLKRRESNKIQNNENSSSNQTNTSNINPKDQRKLSQGRNTSVKRPPLPTSQQANQAGMLKTPQTKVKGGEEEFEEEDDDFPSLSNISAMDQEYDQLQFEDNEEHNNDCEIEDGQEQDGLPEDPKKISSNSLGSSNKESTNVQSKSETANKLLSQELKEESKQLPTVTLLKSVYEGRPSTIFFEYPDCCFKKREPGNRTYTASAQEVKKWNLTYRMNDCNRPYQCVTKSFEAGGFVDTTSNTQWNGYWASNRLDFIKKLNSYQKTNHFAGCWNLGRKDQLWMKVSKQKRKFNADYDFIPRTMLLGSEWDRFSTLLEDNPETLWIVKPVASCCGKGIHVVQKKCKISKRKRKHYLASEYISNPHLINNTKYDLRIYVLVTSYDPLRIYMFDDGLVRFATEKYNINSGGHQKQRFMHLTNYSVNKKSENFVKNNDANDSATGSKWSLKAWKEYLIQTIGEEGKEQLLRRMEDVIIKTCIAVEPYMNDSSSKTAQHRNNCFEVYGFDILIDDTLKPWLLEVNVCPSLSSSSPLDRKIKTSLISDILNTLGFIPYDKKKLLQEKKFHNSNSGVSKKKKVRYSMNSSSGNPNQSIYNKTSKDADTLQFNNILSPVSASTIPTNIIGSNTSTSINVGVALQNLSTLNQQITPSSQQIGYSSILSGGVLMNNTATTLSIATSSTAATVFSEEKRTFSKNIKDIIDLNENNCFSKLAVDDWEILFECDEEQYRSGEFKRIFPCNDLNLVDYYSQFFLFPRYNNIMLWNYMKCSINLLEYICTKNSTIVC